MRLAISSDGSDLNAAVDVTFGRCRRFLFVDPDTLAVEVSDNPAAASGGGAGIQAAQFVVQQGAGAVLTGNVGPNAFQVFEAANVPVFQAPDMTAGDAVQAWRAGRLHSTLSPTVMTHNGVRTTKTRGGNSGRGVWQPEPEPEPAPPPEPPDAARRREIAALQQAAVDLRHQMADVMDRIKRLEDME